MRISLSKTKVKDAKRLGGILLLVLWDEQWGPAPARDGRPTESQIRVGRQMVRDACKANGLTVIDVRIAVRYRGGSFAEHRDCAHLAIHIVGDDWVDKTVEGGARGVEHYHVPPGRPVSSDRKPRNIQMTDEVYAMLERVGGGRAADGLEEIARAYVSSGR